MSSRVMHLALQSVSTMFVLLHQRVLYEREHTVGEGVRGEDSF